MPMYSIVDSTIVAMLDILIGRYNIDGMVMGCVMVREAKGLIKYFTPEDVRISIFGGGKESKDTKDT